MSWGKLLQPDLVLGGSVLSLTPDILRDRNITGLVLDVDDTLVPVTLTDVSSELQTWIATLRPEVAIWLVSNNISRTRISSIAKTLDVPYLLGAGKPSRRKLRQAVEAMQLPYERVAMVGDRLFTDVLAGNRLGMYTILVEPMVNPEQEMKYNPMRNFEVWFSQALGASLVPQQDFINSNHSSN